MRIGLPILLILVGLLILIIVIVIAIAKRIGCLVFLLLCACIAAFAFFLHKKKMAEWVDKQLEVDKQEVAANKEDELRKQQIQEEKKKRLESERKRRLTLQKGKERRRMEAIMRSHAEQEKRDFVLREFPKRARDKYQTIPQTPSVPDSKGMDSVNDFILELETYLHDLTDAVIFRLEIAKYRIYLGRPIKNELEGTKRFINQIRRKVAITSGTDSVIEKLNSRIDSEILMVQEDIDQSTEETEMRKGYFELLEDWKRYRKRLEALSEITGTMRSALKSTGNKSVSWIASLKRSLQIRGEETVRQRILVSISTEIDDLKRLLQEIAAQNKAYPIEKYQSTASRTTMIPEV